MGMTTRKQRTPSLARSAAAALHSLSVFFFSVPRAPTRDGPPFPSATNKRVFSRKPITPVM